MRAFRLFSAVNASRFFCATGLSENRGTLFGGLFEGIHLYLGYRNGSTFLGNAPTWRFMVTSNTVSAFTDNLLRRLRGLRMLLSTVIFLVTSVLNLQVSF